jgi:hypothetical protein
MTVRSASAEPHFAVIGRTLCASPPFGTGPFAMRSPIRFWLARCALGALVSAPCSVGCQTPARVSIRPRSGSWIFGFPSAQDTLWQRFTLRFDGDTVSGVNGGGNSLGGVLHGDSLAFAVSAPELASLLGTSMRYDVADLVGNQVSIVAKMPKAALRGVTRITK